MLRSRIKDIEIYLVKPGILIIKRWSYPSNAGQSFTPFLWNPTSTLIENFKINCPIYRIDIKVLTFFSLSAFLAEGVRFSLRNSSITTFSTVSIEFSNIFWGVEQPESSSFLLVISSNNLGTLPIDAEQRLVPMVGFGEIIQVICSSGAPGVDRKG